MSDDLVREMLREVADGVEPGDRLDAIREATAGNDRHTARGWWAAGGVGLVAASVVTALALTTGGSPRSGAPDPAEPAPNRTTATDRPLTRVMPVYFVGDTPDGPRLYREFQRGVGPEHAGQHIEPDAGPETFALNAALSGAVVDPDYRSLWPEDAAVGPYPYLMTNDLITIYLLGDLHDRPAGMSPAEAGLAVEQVVRTAQALFGQMPIRLRLNGEITDQVLGVPTSEPLTTGSDLAVLAHVSLSDPSEGTTVDNDEPFVVKGAGNSFEGNIVTRIQRLDGAEEIVAELPTIAGTYEDRLFPFEVTFDLTDVPPGDYLVVSRTDDPSGEGRFHTDDRRITVVD